MKPFAPKVAEAAEALEEIEGVEHFPPKISENVVTEEEKVKTFHSLIAETQEEILWEIEKKKKKKKAKKDFLHYWRAFFETMENRVLKRLKFLPDQYLLTLFQY